MKNIINMIRNIINNFIRKHKNKIRDLGQKLIMVAMGVFIATIMLSTISNNDNTKKDDDITNVYKPTETVIKGSDVSKEQYQADTTTTNKFLEFCNNGNIQEAYDLLMDECKEELYPTIEIFKNNYYNNIFNKKRECNLQAWISTNDYTVYRVRYTNDMLATGTYDSSDVYQDYITLNKKNGTEKIALGGFVDSKECNVITKKENIEATVTKKIQHVSYEEYEISIKNNTQKTILLDNLESSGTIRLIAGGEQYTAYTNRLYIVNLLINPGEYQKITIRFKKSFGSNKTSKKIEFLEVIKDYETYTQNKDTYIDKTEFTIKLED